MSLQEKSGIVARFGVSKLLMCALAVLTLPVATAEKFRIRFTDPYGYATDPEKVKIVDRTGNEVQAALDPNGFIDLASGTYVLELPGDYLEKRRQFEVSENSNALTVMLQPGVWAHFHRLRQNKISVTCARVTNADSPVSIKLIHSITGRTQEKDLAAGRTEFRGIPDGRYLVIAQRVGEPIGLWWVLTKVAQPRTSDAGPCSVQFSR